MAPRPNSATHQVLLFIREHPEGVKRRQIIDAFPSIPIPSIDGILARLRNYDLVYNNGVIGAKGSTWFPKTTNDIPSPFPEIAKDLVEELLEIHSDGHELHLAQRLYEIFDNPN